jgi:hypothetical protein
LALLKVHLRWLFSVSTIPSQPLIPGVWLACEDPDEALCPLEALELEELLELEDAELAELDDAEALSSSLERDVEVEGGVTTLVDEERAGLDSIPLRASIVPFAKRMAEVIIGAMQQSKTRTMIKTTNQVFFFLGFSASS